MKELRDVNSVDLTESTLLMLRDVRESLPRCCNTTMGNRTDVITKMNRAIQMSNLLWLRETIRIAAPTLDTIYFDLDNVLFDWRNHLLCICPQYKTIDCFNKDPNRHEVLEKVYRDNPTFFYDLKIMKTGVEALRLACSIPGVNVMFLTASGTDGDAEAICRHKRAALMNLLVVNDLPEELIENLIIVKDSPDKSVYAKPNALLIDDFLKNTRSFIEAGGHAINVPTEDMEEEKAFQIAFNILDLLLKLKS